jgi:hypothetical protein
MAVEITSGRVEYLKFGDDYGFVGLREQGTNTLELFILWFGNLPQGRGPTAMYSLQLTTALARRLRVEISHESTSAFIIQVKLLAPGL